MKLEKSFIFVCIMLMLAALTACSGPTVEEDSVEEDSVDVSATVDAAVAATATSEALFADSVDEAVQATTAAQAAEEESEAEESETAESGADTSADSAASDGDDTSASADASTETSDMYVTMTEEELAATIDEAVNEAVAATEAYYTTTAEATSDGELTTEEVETIELYVEDAEAALAEAEELLAMYYELYAELTYEVIDELNTIEAELEELNANVEEMNATLAEISETLAAGLELAEEQVSELEALAESALVKTEELATQANEWAASVQAEIAARTAQVESIEANAVAGSRQEAVGQLFAYTEAVGAALQDDRVTAAELEQIAQLGANVQVSLQQQGGPQLQNLSGGVNQLTLQLARGGNIPGAKSSLGEFQRSLPER